VSIARWKPKTLPRCSASDSCASMASRAAVRIHFPSRSVLRRKNTAGIEVNNAISGLEIELNRYPTITNGSRLPETSDHFPKYPFDNPTTASAMPSIIPIHSAVNPMLVRKTGITGYSISLEISVNRLTTESVMTTRVRKRYFTKIFCANLRERV